MSSGIIALGGNLPFGDRSPVVTLGRAVAAMAGLDISIRGLSRFFATPCFPAGAGPDYVNAVVAVETAMEPGALLTALHGIEARFGRARARRWGMRTLDLDLVAYGDRVLPDATVQTRWRHLPAEAQVRATPDRLILPHPRLQDRAFVLVPMADVAPGWTHPLTGHSVARMCAALPAADRDAVRPI
ncbi:2-amino-4-hydroxy-6-hydroxymethyldihydropteridine diphosphokinase [Pukyongiella litopenaei]|uniref:2-amino-4-hydroxy-6-hydroxymethyldihydropteridine pyrophosphokinase n=1 Tax=Pukyongiella litopenaei TaxID=2605946 RepID=A0A2S0MRD9_9RHOB|nr:2-amino-4-hydroxy-6-hydroxymethyldihydropteridine diphosphokinase [Pukyongiella litopenaei]AVO38397.1 2-amino-4-hydroxy-6-hydroxymethyldihydropteridine diphosphokinase [Pukyongiella litopenaei]